MKIRRNKATFVSILNKSGRWKNNESIAATLRDRLFKFYGWSREEVSSSIITSKTILSIAIDPTTNVLRKPFYCKDAETLSCTTYPIIDESVLFSSDKNPLRSFIKKSRSASELCNIPPPLSYFHHNSVNDTLLSITDFLGMGRIYYHQDDEYFIVSSNLHAIALCFPQSLVGNNDYWDRFYLHSSAIDDQAYLNDCHCIRPGEKIIFAKGAARILPSHGMDFVENEGESNFNHREEAAIESCKSIFNIGMKLSHSVPHLGLSGGRDSRFIAALALSTGAHCSYETKYPPKLEVEIAQQLVDQAPIPMDWTTSEFETFSTKPDFNVRERGKIWFKITGGDCWSSYLRKDPVWDLNVKRDSDVRVVFTGGSGEIVKSHYYKLADVSDPLFRVKQYRNRMLTFPPFLPKRSKENALQALDGVLLESFLSGFSGLHALDFHFIRSRMKRAYPEPWGNQLTPMLNSAMFRLAFQQPPEEKLSGKIVGQIVNKLVPNWANIPYFNEVSHKYPVEEVNKTLTLPRYWDEEGFSENLDISLKRTHLESLSSAEIMKYQAEGKIGDAYLSRIIEVIHWQSAAEECLDEIRTIRAESPIEYI